MTCFNRDLSCRHHLNPKKNYTEFGNFANLTFVQEGSRKKNIARILAENYCFKVIFVRFTCMKIFVREDFGTEKHPNATKSCPLDTSLYSADNECSLSKALT